MKYHVVPTGYAVAYQNEHGELVSVMETQSGTAAEREAARMNAEFQASMEKARRYQQPPRRKARYFPEDKFA